MRPNIFGWLTNNLSSLALAFVLAVVVWVSAVVTADPNEEHAYRPIDLEITGQSANLVMTSEIPTQVQVTLQAPLSIWNQINNNPSLVHAWIDLSGYEAGTHMVQIKTQVSISPVRLLSIEPEEIQVKLEPLVSRDYPVQFEVEGDPPLGYRLGESEFTPTEVTISGPQSLVEQVTAVSAHINVEGASEPIKSTVPLVALDKDGSQVPTVTISPRTINVDQPISLLGGYKNVVVKVQTTGQIASGYRLTNISVTPPNVTVFSTNPQLVNAVPGYVETLPVDLTELSDDIDIRMSLNLPDGVTLVGEQSVLVQVGVAAIEGSLTLSLPVEVLDLPPELQAQISPATVNIIVVGPLPILEKLTPASFRVVINASDLEPGAHQLAPVVDLAPGQVRVQAILPETVEVTISAAPATTPTPTAQAILMLFAQVLKFKG